MSKLPIVSWGKTRKKTGEWFSNLPPGIIPGSSSPQEEHPDATGENSPKEPWKIYSGMTKSALLAELAKRRIRMSRKTDRGTLFGILMRETGANPGDMSEDQFYATYDFHGANLREGQQPHDPRKTNARHDGRLGVARRQATRVLFLRSGPLSAGASDCGRTTERDHQLGAVQGGRWPQAAGRRDHYADGCRHDQARAGSLSGVYPYKFRRTAPACRHRSSPAGPVGRIRHGRRHSPDQVQVRHAA